MRLKEGIQCSIMNRNWPAEVYMVLQLRERRQKKEKTEIATKSIKEQEVLQKRVGSVTT